MTATTFNPLEAVRDLEAAGVERGQAEAIAEGMRRAATADHDSLVMAHSSQKTRNSIAVPPLCSLRRNRRRTAPA